MLVQGIGAGRDVEARARAGLARRHPRDRARPRLLRAAAERARARRRRGADRARAPQRRRRARDRRRGSRHRRRADRDGAVDRARARRGRAAGQLRLRAARAPRWCSRREDCSEVLIVRAARGRVPRRPPLAGERGVLASDRGRRRGRRDVRRRRGARAAGGDRSRSRRPSRSTAPFRYEGVQRRRPSSSTCQPGWEPTLDSEHDDYRWLPREEAAELLFWPEPAELLRSAGVSELWHFSEDPTIEVFRSRRSELHALEEPLVWADRLASTGGSTGSRATAPRACFSATEDDDATRTSSAGSTAIATRRVGVIETVWLERMRAARALRVPAAARERSSA